MLQFARGGLDGNARRIEVVGSIIMAATAPPEMRETHLGRFALIRMLTPEHGEDFRDQHRALIETMRERGGKLWGRALASWERYNTSLTAFRTALAEEGCAPREMDQLGAVLAGWWVLTHEGAPNARYAREGVLAIAGFVRTSDIVAEDSNGRRLLQHMMTKSVVLDRSSARAPVGSLIEALVRSFVSGEQTDGVSRFVAEAALSTHGIRVIAPNQIDRQNRLSPHLSANGGVWINHRCTELAGLFTGSDWEASRWISALAEIDRVKRSENTVRIGAVMVKRAIWVPLEELQITGEDYQDTS